MVLKADAIIIIIIIIIIIHDLLTLTKEYRKHEQDIVRTHWKFKCSWKEITPKDKSKKIMLTEHRQTMTKIMTDNILFRYLHETLYLLLTAF